MCSSPLPRASLRPCLAGTLCPRLTSHTSYDITENAGITPCVLKVSVRVTRLPNLPIKVNRKTVPKSSGSGGWAPRRTPRRGPSRPRAAAGGTHLREGFSEVGRAFPAAHTETRAAAGLPGPTIPFPPPDPFACQSLEVLPIVEGTECMSHLPTSLRGLRQPNSATPPALRVPYSPSCLRVLPPSGGPLAAARPQAHFVPNDTAWGTPAGVHSGSQRHPAVARPPPALRVAPVSAGQAPHRTWEQPKNQRCRVGEAGLTRGM